MSQYQIKNVVVYTGQNTPATIIGSASGNAGDLLLGYFIDWVPVAPQTSITISCGATTPASVGTVQAWGDSQTTSASNGGVGVSTITTTGAYAEFSSVGSTSNVTASARVAVEGIILPATLSSIITFNSASVTGTLTLTAVIASSF